jgi:polyhydroxyalkanoate synthesis regulator phasin
VWVLNVGGYVGDSTKSEITYAERLGRPVRYLLDEFPDYTEPVDPLTAALTRVAELEAELTNFHGAIDELSIGVAAHAVEMFYTEKVGGPTTTCNPDQVRGVFKAIEKHAKTMGDFGRRAVEDHYKLPNLQARMKELEAERERLRSDGLEFVHDKNAAMGEADQLRERVAELEAQFAKLAFAAGHDTVPSHELAVSWIEQLKRSHDEMCEIVQEMDLINTEYPIASRAEYIKKLRERVAELEGEVEREPCPVCGEGTMRWGENPQRYTCDNCGAQFADAEAQFVKFASEDIAALEGREGKALAAAREFLELQDAANKPESNMLEPTCQHINAQRKLEILARTTPLARDVIRLVGENERLKEKLLRADGALVDILAVLLPGNLFETSLRDMAKTPSEIAEMVKAEIKRYRAALGELRRWAIADRPVAIATIDRILHECGIDPEALGKEELK